MLGTTRFGRRNHLLLAFAGVLATLVGCQLVAGISARKLDPINPGCVLPSTGGGPQVRVANLAPTSDLVDVCIRNAGSADWGRPILLDGGTSCADAGALGAVRKGRDVLTPQSQDAERPLADAAAKSKRAAFDLQNAPTEETAALESV